MMAGMADSIQLFSPPITVYLSRSSRARRFSLRVSSHDGQVRLTLPQNGSRRAALAFIKRQEGWLRQALDQRPARVVPEYGGTCLFEGRPHLLVPTSGRRISAGDGQIHIPGPAETLRPKLQAFLKTSARARLVQSSAAFADKVGATISATTLRDTRSRWGSCSSKGRLMFSWRLIMAPPEVLNYVAAHEVAHLVEMNHSPAFWEIVARLMPDFTQHRHWLRQNGALLHSVCFQGC